MTGTHRYICNCADNKDKPYKYREVETYRNGQCINCDHFAIAFPKDVKLKCAWDVITSSGREVAKEEAAHE